MKKLITILFVLFSFVSFSQSIVPRASAGNTVQDQRLYIAKNFGIPIFDDTTQANLPVNIGLDSIGTLIFAKDVNNFCIRVANPKHWQQGGVAGSVLPDGVYSGGQVVYSGTGYSYIVTAAVFVLNGILYTSAQDTVTLDPADPTFDRVDVIGLTTYIGGGTGGVITGTPSANPQEPSVDPLAFIRRSVVTVVANTTEPPNIDQTILYDLGAGEPTEWTTNSDGNTNFLDNSNPYHLTIDALTTNMVSLQRIRIINDDTVNSAARSTLVIPINIATQLAAGNNFYAQLVYQGNPVSQLLPFTKYGLLKNVTGSYQIAAFPFPEFGANNIVFDEVDIVLIGGVTFPSFYLDYIQIQSGLSIVTTIPNQKFGDPQGDNFATTPRSFDFNNTDFVFNNINKFVSRIAPTSDSAFLISRTNGSPLLRVDGITNTTNVFQFNAANDLFIVDASAARVRGTGIFLQFLLGAGVQSYQQPTLWSRSYPTIGLTSTHVNLALTNDTLNTYFDNDSLTYKPLSVRLRSFTDNIEREKLYINGAGHIWSTTVPHTATADTVFVWKNGFYQGMTIPEFKTLLASGGTVTSIGFNTGTGITSTAVPLTTTGTVGIDTTVIATRAWAQSISGGGGITGVTSVGATDGNGFDFTVTNPTTTPVITLTSTVGNTQLLYSNSGALAGSSALTWTNATSRLGVGATSAAYLSLAASTTSQASLNVGNAGTAPTSPNNGDMWIASNNLFVRLNGSTVQISNPAAAGVTSITGTASQVIASGATGAVTLSLPQSIATTSSPTFQTLTLSGAASTANLVLGSHTDPTAVSGVMTYNGRLAFSYGSGFRRVITSSDVTPTAGQGLFGNGTDFTVGNYSPANNSVLVSATSAGVTFRTNSVVQTLSGTSVTMNINNGENAQWTLTASGSSLAVTNPIAGRLYFVNVVQDGTGSRTITSYPAGTVWYSGTAPVLKTTGGQSNLLSFYYNGSNFYGYDWGSGAGGGGFVNPMTTIGDIIYASTGGAASRLAGNITTTMQSLTQTGTGVASQAPVWRDAITSYSSTNTIDFPNTGAQTSSEISVAVANAAVGDRIIVGSTVNPVNSVWSASCQVAGQVTIRFCNFSAVAINPASGTFKVYVVK